MKVPLTISFHGITPSAALEQEITARAAKLDRFYNRLVSCRVVIEEPHRHHRKGNLFHVRIELGLPGNDIIIKRTPTDSDAYENVHIAIREAFQAALRKLQSHVDKHRGEVKQHNGPPHGRVIRYFPADGCGFLETPDGREVYFHERSVLNGDFRNLTVGSEVRFAEEEGEKGPQASTVELVGRDGKHHFPQKKAG